MIETIVIIIAYALGYVTALAVVRSNKKIDEHDPYAQYLEELEKGPKRKSDFDPHANGAPVFRKRDDNDPSSSGWI